MSLEAQDSPTIRTTCGVLILLFIVISVQANAHCPVLSTRDWAIPALRASSESLQTTIRLLKPSPISGLTILEKEIFTHVLTNISDYRRLIIKKLVTILKPFKFASDLRKPHLSNSMRSKVIQL